jgi:hypothetical protein
VGEHVDFGHEICSRAYPFLTACRRAYALEKEEVTATPTARTMMTPSHSGHWGHTREVFSVDGQRVTLEAHQGWQCTCAAHTEASACVHVQQAQIFRAMRGVSRDDDTIELELSATELQRLAQAACVEHSHTPETRDVRPTQRRRGSRPARRWPAVIAAAAISGVSSGITYLATTRPVPTPSAAQPVLSASLAAPIRDATSTAQVSVKFVNPFDATEVFEFPPGTSEADAHQAVAELLLKRAHERLAASSADSRPPSRTAVNRDRTVPSDEVDSSTRLSERAQAAAL